MKVRLVEPTVLMNPEAPVELAQLLPQLWFRHFSVGALRREQRDEIIRNISSKQFFQNMRQYARDRRAARPILDENQNPVAAPDDFAQTRRAMRRRKAAREYGIFVHFTEGTRRVETHQVRIRHFDRRDPLVTGI
jgi:hypothetical protein